MTNSINTNAQRAFELGTLPTGMRHQCLLLGAESKNLDLLCLGLDILHTDRDLLSSETLQRDWAGNEIPQSLLAQPIEIKGISLKSNDRKALAFGAMNLDKPENPSLRISALYSNIQNTKIQNTKIQYQAGKDRFTQGDIP